MTIKSHGATNRTIVVLFWVILIISWFATLGQRSLIHPDEGRYAELSLGMLMSGDWITPRLNGILYFEKPALQYWMGALSFKAFGINEFAARFWPGLTGILSVLTVALTARRIWRHENAGQYTALVMASSFWVISNSHFLTLDSGLMFFLTLTLCAFLWAQQDGASLRERRYGMWLAWAAMAGAALSKGLVGLLIPGCTLVLYSMINGQWSLWRRMQFVPGLIIFLLLAGPWFWLVSQRNPGFAYFFFIHEHFARYLTNEAKREGAIWYFIPILLVGFLPWTSLLPRLVIDAWPRRPGVVFQAERFLLIWAIFVFVFFSISHSKLPSYILPMFPALSLLLGQTLTRARATALKKHLLLPGLVFGLGVCAYPFVAYLVASGATEPVMQSFALYLSIGCAVFLFCAALAWRFLAQEKKLAAVMLLAAGGFSAVSIGCAGHEAFSQLKSSKFLVKQISSYVRPDMEIFTLHNAYDQTLPFYLRRSVTQVDYEDEFDFGHKAEPDKYIPTVREFLSRWQAAPQAMALMDISVFNALQQQGMAMKPVYQDAHRMVVIKP